MLFLVDLGEPLFEFVDIQDPGMGICETTLNEGFKMISTCLFVFRIPGSRIPVNFQVVIKGGLLTWLKAPLRRILAIHLAFRAIFAAKKEKGG